MILFEETEPEAIIKYGDSKRVVESREEYHDLIQYLNLAPIKSDGRADLTATSVLFRDDVEEEKSELVMILSPLSKYTTSDPFFENMQEGSSLPDNDVIMSHGVIDKYMQTNVQIPQNLVLLTPDFYLSLPDFPESFDTMVKENYKRICNNCSTTPTSAAICLLCDVMLCKAMDCC